MTFDEARALLQKHAGRSEHHAVEDGFLGMLRPFKKLREDYFQELMAALRAVAPLLQKSALDRDLVADLWELLFLSWLWALSPAAKTQRSGIITPQDQVTLAGWLEEIGLTVSLMLGGEVVPDAPSARKMIAAKARA